MNEKIVDILSSIVLELMNRDDVKKEKEPSTFMYCILFKTCNHLKSSLALKALYDVGAAYVSDSTLVIHRAVISDLMLAIDVMSRSDKSSIVDNIHKVKSEHYQRMMYSNYREFYKQKGETNEDYDERIRENLPEYFTEEKYKLNSLNTAKRIIEDIGMDSKELKYAIKSANGYFDIFSKLEHFGGMTYQFIHWPFKSDKQNIVEEYWDDSFETILLLSKIIVEYLKPSKDLKLAYYKNIDDKFSI